MTYNTFLDIKTNEIPLEQMVLISHKYGIEAVVFWSASWKYVYTGKSVEPEVLKTTTHFLIPQKPNE